MAGLERAVAGGGSRTHTCLQAAVFSTAESSFGPQQAAYFDLSDVQVRWGRFRASWLSAQVAD